MLWLISGQTYVVLRKQRVFLKNNYVYFKYVVLVKSLFFYKYIIKYLFLGVFFILFKVFLFILRFS